jgi:ankyrin repeat protein
MIAARNGDSEILEALLARDADVKATTINGITALMLAAGFGSEACVRALLAKGAEATAENGQGKTARAMAEEKGFNAIARLLAEAEGLPYQRPDQLPK